MPKINLRDLYPYYNEDLFVEVSDELIEAIKEMERAEAAYVRRMQRYKAFYSLDRNDGIEYVAIVECPTPEDVFENRMRVQQLYTAVSKLPKMQAERIYAHFFLEMNYADIARCEGVRGEAVEHAIKRGLERLRKYLKDN